MEKWKDIPGFEGLYEASSLGRVLSYNGRWTKGEARILSPVICKHGYRMINLPNLHGKGKRYQCSYKVADLVARSFIGPKPSGAVVNHIDGNKANDSAGNLEYVSPKENSIHAWQNGLTPQAPRMPGESNPRCKISEESAREIIHRLHLGHRKCDIAKDLATTWDTVNQIHRGASWKHIERPEKQ